MPNRFDNWFVLKNIFDVGRGFHKPGQNLPCGWIKVDIQYSEPFNVNCFRPIWWYKYNVLLTISHFRVKGALDAFNKIVAESGVKGLYRGVIPNVQRAALVNMGGKHIFLKKSCDELQWRATFFFRFSMNIFFISIYWCLYFYFLAML